MVVGAVNGKSMMNIIRVNGMLSKMLEKIKRSRISKLARECKKKFASKKEQHCSINLYFLLFQLEFHRKLSKNKILNLSLIC